jgi:hypothetical protein
MSLVTSGPEVQDSLFTSEKPQNIPKTLARATQRLEFPPSYVVVGVYRLVTDRLLWVPAWDKCRHATRRGLVVGAVWVSVVEVGGGGMDELLTEVWG